MILGIKLRTPLALITIVLYNYAFKELKEILLNTIKSSKNVIILTKNCKQDVIKSLKSKAETNGISRTNNPATLGSMLKSNWHLDQKTVNLK